MEIQCMTIASMQSSSGSLEIWLAMEESSAADQTEPEPAETPAPPTGTTWRHRLFTILFYAIFLFIIIIAGRLFWSNASVLRKAVEVPLWYWALPSALYLGTLVFKGLSFDLLAEVFGARVPLRDSIALTSIGLLGNYALPGNASLPLRSLYFERVHHVSYKQFIPLALAGFIYATAQYGVVAGLVALYLGPVPSKTYSGVMIVFSGVSLAAMILLLLPYRRLVTPYRQLAFLDRYIAMALEGWRLLLGSHARFGRWLLCEILRAFFEVTFFLSVVSRSFGYSGFQWGWAKRLSSSSLKSASLSCGSRPARSASPKACRCFSPRHSGSTLRSLSLPP
jgi:hypothetical protein